MTDDQVRRLWDEINQYVITCGGDPSKHVYGNLPRQKAVANISSVIKEIEGGLVACSHPDCCSGTRIYDNGMRAKCTECDGRGVSARRRS
jgi:hypothetical protein